nr:MAG TPA: PemK-like protein [Caudoviricetes sp.]
MDLKKPENKGALLSKIAELASSINTFLKNILAADQHKAALLYYWLRNYLRYIKQEETFNPKYFPQFKPGDIVKVDFGFGIGSEFGGLHYAIVLTPSNSKNSTVTVVPLRSLKLGKESPKTLYKSDVYLGTELFTVLLDRSGKMLDKCSAFIKEVENTDHKTITAKDIARFEKQLDEAKDLLDKHNIIMKEISRLNAGTVAIVSQIRTVSKIRIQNPKYLKDALYNMRVDKQATDKIRAVMKDLYNIK